MQPCCEALTLRHAWLNLISVHASEERERERERGRKREEKRGGAADPGRQRRKKRHVLNMCPACTCTGSPAQSCRTRGKKRRRGTQAGRQKGGGGGGEGRRERAEKPGPRKRNDPNEKTRGVLRPKSRQKHYTPTREPSPEKRTNIPPKFSPQNSVNRYP